MKCNCNQNYNNGYSNNNRYSNCCCRPASFVAYTTDNTTPTPVTPKDCPTNLILDKIAFSSGAICAKDGSSKIFITQPGFYQVSYLIVGKKKAHKGGSPAQKCPESTPPKYPDPPKKCVFTSFIAENCTQLACKTSEADPCDDGPTILSAVDTFYVSCNDLPTTLSLAVTTSCPDIIFNYSVTVNKFCPENVNAAFATPGYLYGFPYCDGAPFVGCENCSNYSDNCRYNRRGDRDNDECNCRCNGRGNSGCSGRCNSRCNGECNG